METPTTKDKVEELKIQWKQLWRDHIDDKLRAERIADKEYSELFVEKGMVIFATRRFRMLSFREILEMHGVIDVERIIPPSPHTGGWRKFIRTMIAPQRPAGKLSRAAQYLVGEKPRQQLKKGGRGWLHL